MMSRKNFQCALAGAALTACAIAAPTAALAQQGNYVPGFEPRHALSNYGLLAAYGMATVSLAEDGRPQVKVAGSSMAPAANLAADLASPRLSLASSPVQMLADLRSATMPRFSLAAKAPAKTILIASRR